MKWSNWNKFPDPSKMETLCAPIGPGVYELRLKNTRKLILCGISKNVAYRMTSLIPRPIGSGTRKNTKKSQYVLNHIQNIEYRSLL